MSPRAAGSRRAGCVQCEPTSLNRSLAPGLLSSRHCRVTTLPHRGFPKCQDSPALSISTSARGCVRGCSIGRCSSFSTGSGAANKHVAAFRSGQPFRRNHEARKVGDAFERADPEVCRLLAQHRCGSLSGSGVAGACRPPRGATSGVGRLRDGGGADKDPNVSQIR
jgi:hypothetical protein